MSVINAMETNKTKVKETRLLVGAEEGLLALLYRIVGKGFTKAIFEQGPEGVKGASFSGICKYKDLEQEHASHM